MNEKPARYRPRKVRWLEENKTPTGSLAQEWPQWRATTERWQKVMPEFMALDLRHIIGWEDKYLVSSCGRVFSRHGETLAFFHKRNYRSVKLVRSAADQRTKLVHRIVAEAFIPNPENKASVNHKNGVSYDNKVENLEWTTPKENAVHAIAVLGRYGSPKPGIKLLTLSQLQEIFRLSKSGLSPRKIGKIFNRGHSNIVKILKGKNYPHVTKQMYQNSLT